MSISIVAEAAQGFEGDPALARRLVCAAADAGADLIKFQLVYADELATPAYQHYELFRKLEMPDDAWRSVAEEAALRRIGLAFDVYGARSLAVARALGARALKVHSTDFFNHDLVRSVVATGLDVWFSTGGITLDEVREFLASHRPVRSGQLTMLFGFQAEPTALEDNRLAQLALLRRSFPDLRVGFMDHAAGDSDAARWLGVLVVPYGVAIIEKHITIARTPPLEDSVSALESADFLTYVNRIRSAESAIGEGAVEATEAERRYRGRALKVVVAARALAVGQPVDAAAVALLCTPVPPGSTPLNRLEEAVGRVMIREKRAGEPIAAEDVS